MKNYSFSDIHQRDQALLQLAYYDVTEGRIVLPDSEYDFLEFTKSVAGRFNYFKTIIQNGTCTFAKIRNDVLSRNGPFPQKAVGLDEFLDNVVDEDNVIDVFGSQAIAQADEEEEHRRNVQKQVQGYVDHLKQMMDGGGFPIVLEEYCPMEIDPDSNEFPFRPPNPHRPIDEEIIQDEEDEDDLPF